MIEVSQALNLPPIPSLSIVLHSSLTDLKTRETLRAITTVFSGYRKISRTKTRVMSS